MVFIVVGDDQIIYPVYAFAKQFFLKTVVLIRRSRIDQNAGTVKTVPDLIR